MYPAHRDSFLNLSSSFPVSACFKTPSSFLTKSEVKVWIYLQSIQHLSLVSHLFYAPAWSSTVPQKSSWLSFMYLPCMPFFSPGLPNWQRIPILHQPLKYSPFLTQASGKFPCLQQPLRLGSSLLTLCSIHWL